MAYSIQWKLHLLFVAKTFKTHAVIDTWNCKCTRSFRVFILFGWRAGRRVINWSQEDNAHSWNLLRGIRHQTDDRIHSGYYLLTQHMLVAFGASWVGREQRPAHHLISWKHFNTLRHLSRSGRGRRHYTRLGKLDGTGMIRSEDNAASKLDHGKIALRDDS